jgi:hypothetical protein
LGSVPDYSDYRLTLGCLYCGGEKTTRDHAPSKVLLDTPLPADLPVVGACQPCNEGFSQDEEYLACLLDCAISGTTEPDKLRRSNVARKLREQPALRARIEKSRLEADGYITFSVETGRIENVVKKLAQGHILYELSEVFRDEPSSIWFKPLHTLHLSEREAFETISLPPIWPEMGCRMMTRLATGNPGWQVIQPHRYRYATIFGGPTVARIVLSEYLACEVAWDD